MRLLTLVKCSYLSLRKNKMRSFLSILGIIIGVVTVIAVLTLSEAFRTYVINEYNQIGNNLMWAMPDNTKQSNNKIGRLKSNDINKFNDFNFISGLSPYASTQQYIKMNGQEGLINVVGTNSYYDNLRMLDVQGRFINDIDNINISRICVISDDIRKKFLYRDMDPNGNTITFNGMEFTVVGFLPPKKSNTQIGLSEDNSIYIPINTYRRSFQTDDIDMILFSVADETKAEQYKSIISQKFLDTKDGGLKIKVDSVYENKKNAKFLFSIITVVTVLITSIGLVVSGIGIMNVLLMSIAERKWEIGLRKAIGADNGSILLQFLVESVLLCFTGAVIGLVLSLILIITVCFFAKINANLSWYAIIVSVSFCNVIGVFFGIFPAIKASKLDPMECLEQ